MENIFQVLNEHTLKQRRCKKANEILHQLAYPDSTVYRHELDVDNIYNSMAFMTAEEKDWYTQLFEAGGITFE